MKVDLYGQTGEKKGTVALNEKIFGQNVSHTLIQAALVRQMANKRFGSAHVKTRTDVRGGGRKPFRQKGTGNARQGSTRSPIQRGGGVVFGPKNTRNYAKAMPKKQRRKALFSALSAKMNEGQVVAYEGYKTDEIKTKNIAALMKKLPIERNALFVLDTKNEPFMKSARNIPELKSILVSYLNIADLLKYDKVIFFTGALAKMDELFLGTEKEAAKKATSKEKEPVTA